MSKFISVPSAYVLYQVEDDVFQMITGSNLSMPPQVVLELMVMNGQAKRVGVVGTLELNQNAVEEEEEEDEEPPEGQGPWLSEE